MPTFEEVNDAPASTETPYHIPSESLTAGGQFIHGTFTSKEDHDWYEIKLEKGKTYRLAVVGIGKSYNELARNTHLELRDAQGNLVSDQEVTYATRKDKDGKVERNKWAADGDHDIWP